MLASGGTVSLVVGGLESSEKTHLTLGCMGTSRGTPPDWPELATSTTPTHHTPKVGWSWTLYIYINIKKERSKIIKKSGRSAEVGRAERVSSFQVIHEALSK